MKVELKVFNLVESYITKIARRLDPMDSGIYEGLDEFRYNLENEYYPSLRNEEWIITWTDRDGDNVEVWNDEELKSAIEHMMSKERKDDTAVLKFYLREK